MTTIAPADLIAPAATPAEPQALYAGLRKLMRDCGSNKHHQAIVLITACIGEGITQGRDIVRTLQRLGLNAQHAGKTLAEGIGDQPDRHRWSKGASGRYGNQH